MSDTPVPVEVFCFYAVEDETSFGQLKMHLITLIRHKRINLSTNHPGNAGFTGINEKEYIAEHLDNAALVLLLLSPAFVSSDDMVSPEMERVMERQRAKQVRLVPILLKPVNWNDEAFAGLTPLPTNHKCVAEWSDKDAAFVNIGDGLRQVIDDLPKSIFPFPPQPVARLTGQAASTSPSSVNIVTPQPFTSAAEIVKIKREQQAFDVFLCHHGVDKPAVREIGALLEAQGILPWLDENELPPGLPWQELLEQQIGLIKTAAVFVGKSGIGPWQEHELYAFLREFVDRRCPVIPVLLPDADQTPVLPLFLKAMTWVDFRKKEPAPLPRLIWGITGKRPGG